MYREPGKGERKQTKMDWLVERMEKEKRSKKSMEGHPLV